MLLIDRILWHKYNLMNCVISRQVLPKLSLGVALFQITGRHQDIDVGGGLLNQCGADILQYLLDLLRRTVPSEIQNTVKGLLVHTANVLDVIPFLCILAHLAVTIIGIRIGELIAILLLLLDERERRINN